MTPNVESVHFMGNFFLVLSAMTSATHALRRWSNLDFPSTRSPAFNGGMRSKKSSCWESEYSIVTMFRGACWKLVNMNKSRTNVYFTQNLEESSNLASVCGHWFKAELDNTGFEALYLYLIQCIGHLLYRICIFLWYSVFLCPSSKSLVPKFRPVFLGLTLIYLGMTVTKAFGNWDAKKNKPKNLQKINTFWAWAGIEVWTPA